MTKCRHGCDYGEHHKKLSRDERLSHLEECMADLIHQLQCIKDELAEIRRQP
ncbi:MAG: hypothetical protein HXY34_06870 [Candidatus Thorarchaeota archaeon]|nr:hypothetical protein [Candidatus Thorarchaeota archaeon]